MKIRKLLLLMTFSTFIHATEESMDELLDTFAHKSDLSQKTKIANAGNVRIFTREELERTQAHSLKDVLNTLPFLNYVENSLGFPDLDYTGDYYPFHSNSIRIYIDNQEVSTALYGSGLFHLGNIGIDFVDHIEVYTLNPSFEHSTEPARVLIKLYSKDANRDAGLKVSSTVGSRGHARQNIQYATKVDDVSYFSYISALNDQRKKHQSFDATLSRDQERYFIFGKIDTKTQHLQLQAIKNNKDTFTGLAEDGRSQKASTDTEYFHIGYENNALKNLSLSAVYEEGKAVNDYKTDYYSLEYDVEEKIITLDGQYKYDGIENNELILGAKYRYKKFVVPRFIFNNIASPPSQYDTQEMSSFYLENQYAFNPQWLLSLGTQIGEVRNNSVVENQNIKMARVGLVYTNQDWVSKTFLHNSSFFVEPYSYVDTLANTNQALIKPENIKNITQELSYGNESHQLTMILGYNYKENAATIEGQALVNRDKSETELFTGLEHEYKYNKHHTLLSNFSYISSKNIYLNDLSKGDDELTEYKVMLQGLSHYNKFDIMNQFIYNHNTVTNQHFLNYSAGIKYRYNDKLTLSVKGENILNKAREDYFDRGRRNQTTGNWDSLEPLYIAPIDQSIYFRMEYFF